MVKLRGEIIIVNEFQTGRIRSSLIDNKKPQKTIE